MSHSARSQGASVVRAGPPAARPHPMSPRGCAPGLLTCPPAHLLGALRAPQCPSRRPPPPQVLQHGRRAPPWLRGSRELRQWSPQPVHDLGDPAGPPAALSPLLAVSHLMCCLLSPEFAFQIFFCLILSYAFVGNSGIISSRKASLICSSSN